LVVVIVALIVIPIVHNEFDIAERPKYLNNLLFGS